MNTKSEKPTDELTDSEIREILLAHGYTIKSGMGDLRPYVYAGARAVVAADRARAAPAGGVVMPVAAWICIRTPADTHITYMGACKHNDGLYDVPLVLQSDAQAALAAQAAEVARLTAERDALRNAALGLLAALSAFGEGDWADYQNGMGEEVGSGLDASISSMHDALRVKKP